MTRIPLRYRLRVWFDASTRHAIMAVWIMLALPLYGLALNEWRPSHLGLFVIGGTVVILAVAHLIIVSGGRS